MILATFTQEVPLPFCDPAVLRLYQDSKLSVNLSETDKLLLNTFLPAGFPQRT